MKLNWKSPSAAGIVAGAAFIASAGHIVSVVDATNHIGFALAYPIGIDGLIYVGIRSLQEKRLFSGALALLIGAVYSLAFNAHAEGALTMPKLMIASSMPVCMFAAFLIEAFGAKTEEIVEAPAPLPVPAAVPAAAPRPITWERPRPNGRPVLPIVPKVAQPVRVKATVQAPKPVETKDEKPALTSGRTRGRTAAWDVEKTVGLIEDGRTDADVLAAVDGLGLKPLQRTRRAVRLLREDALFTDGTVASIVGQSAAHIARVRAAMKG